MATESNVVIAPDNTGASAHNVRTVTVYPTGGVSTSHGEEQQVVTLAGSDGTTVEVTAGAIPVHSDEITTLLKAIILRLDLLNAMVDSTYTPPDDIAAY